MTEAVQHAFDFGSPVEVVPPVLIAAGMLRLSNGASTSSRVVVAKERLDGGDIDRSYSGDLIDQGKIRNTFPFNGWPYVTTSGVHGPSGHECKAYKLVPEAVFAGEAQTFSAKVHPDGGESARNDPSGFYHGIGVRYQGRRFVLVGPPIIFTAQSDETRSHLSV